MENNVIAIVVNNDFAHYVRTLLNSIKKNWSSHPPILLYLCNDVDSKFVEEYSKYDNLTCQFYNPSDLEYRSYLVDSGKNFSTKAFNDSGFFILNFFNPKFEEYNDILVLDVDMLVLKNLDELFLDKDFFGISAANSKIFPVFSIDKKWHVKFFQFIYCYFLALTKGIFIPFGVSFNSGVVKISKSDRTLSKYNSLIDILINFRLYCPSDQEIILLWMLKNKKKISNDFRFNFQARFFNAVKKNTLPKIYREMVQKASHDIHILHFNGPKPDTKQFITHLWTEGRSELVDLYMKYQSF